ncbi:MAG: type II secretion system F family protein [bacterium]|nr:type II secretion system F family protein [bacterium]
MLYHYIASDKTGTVVESDFDAETLDILLQHLAGLDLKPIAVQSLKDATKPRLFSGKITISDKVFLAKSLSLMLRVGTDLLSAIDILIADFDKPAMKNLLLEVRDNLTKGKPFYEAFARYPKVFSPVFINLVKAAEASGNLQQIFDDLSESLEREAELRGNIRAAMIYPIILLIVSLAIFIFLSTFALPKIAQVFSDSSIQPPLFSRIVFFVGLFINDHLLALGLGAIFILSPLVYFFAMNRTGKALALRITSNLPVLKKVYRDLAVQRFSSTFGALMKAGLPIIQATRITADVVGIEEFRVSLLRIADEGLAKGLTIGDAFKREIVFPKVVSNLIAISEKAGHLEEVLDTLSKFYATQVNASVRSFVSVLEPALLLTMGVLVGGIALSIIVPIYQLTTQF